MVREHGVVLKGEMRIPAGVFTFENFQAWVASRSFPETGRIDFLAGDVEVEMSPEDLQTHAVVKTAIVMTLAELIVGRDRGEVYIDSTRVVCADAGLSVEPDVVVALWESFETGRVRYAKSALDQRSSAIEGAPDVIVEIVSHGSVRKDTEILPLLYAKAGIPELWLADARGGQLRFTIQSLHEGKYQTVEPDADGWLRSARLGGRFRLVRQPTHLGHWRYVLEHRGA
jgi:Uma2 family endonuclease